MLLSEMVADLRAEVGHSLISGQGTNMEDTLKYTLKRTQRELYAMYDWPQFIIDEQVAITAGTRYLTGLVKIDEEQINHMWCRLGSEWYPILMGIDPAHWSLYDSDSDVRSFPIQRYSYDESATGLELWPITSVDTTILVRGQALLPDLIEDTDKSMLDGLMVVMFAAAGILARQRDEDAAQMLTKANQYMTSIRKQSGSNKRTTRSMARADGGRRPRAGIDYIPRGPGF